MSVLKDLPSVPDYSADWDAADKEEDYQLCEVAGNGMGVIGYYGGKSMEIADAHHFMREQFSRFGLEPPDKAFISWCWDTAFYYVDQYDPYALMTGCCDVIKTEEAYYYQYAVSDDGHDWVEVSPDEIETFRHWDKGAESWEILMRSPGLKEYWDHLYDYFDDTFNFMEFEQDPKYMDEEWEFLRNYGPKVKDLAHLGVWAAIMWMSSPRPAAKAWRHEFHPIFRICYEYEACVLHGWTFHDPRYFDRIERKPKTCSKCGIDAYCVDLTKTGHETSQYICEHCLSEGLPFPGRSCGTRLCENTACQHHPVAKAPDSEKGVARREVMAMAADQRFGALRQIGNGKRVRELPGYIKLNEIAMDKYAGQISNTVADVFGLLIGPSKDD